MEAPASDPGLVLSGLLRFQEKERNKVDIRETSCFLNTVHQCTFYKPLLQATFTLWALVCSPRPEGQARQSSGSWALDFRSCSSQEGSKAQGMHYCPPDSCPAAGGSPAQNWFSLVPGGHPLPRGTQTHSSRPKCILSWKRLLTP